MPLIQRIQMRKMLSIDRLQLPQMMCIPTVKFHGVILLRVKLQSRMRVEPAATCLAKTALLENGGATVHGFPSAMLPATRRELSSGPIEENLMSLDSL